MSDGNSTALGERTTAGNYFVSNYPPYSFWNADEVGRAHEALDRAPRPGTPLGVYVHIPFCRKRCHFCYFKIYTDKNAREVERYTEALLREQALYWERRFVAGRTPSFVYFGGGTPSYLSSRQLTRLAEGMSRLADWRRAEEITFECEPGTLSEHKLQALREMGVTRLSLGIENFDQQILRLNGRAHGAEEIGRSYQFARSIGFPQINIDLIAGMLGETEANWRDCVRRTIDLAADSVTIYQMEIPYNTTIFQQMKAAGEVAAPVADWPTKRRWVDYAFRELEQAGYTISSAYTAVREAQRTGFLYRDLLWTGADMVGLGVASFSHVNGAHFQNESGWEPYLRRLESGELPIQRALTVSDEERLIREFVLQMKLGRVRREYFRRKFGVDVRERFAAVLGELEEQGLMEVDAECLRLSREGLLAVDGLLPRFFLPQHRTSRMV